MGEWSNLTQREKSNIIRFAIKNGVSDINTIRDTFNVYAGEGHLHEGTKSDSKLHIPTREEYITQKLDYIQNTALEASRRKTQAQTTPVYARDVYGQKYVTDVLLKGYVEDARNQVERLKAQERFRSKKNNSPEFIQGNINTGYQSVRLAEAEKSLETAEKMLSGEIKYDGPTLNNCIANLSEFFPHGLPYGNETFSNNPKKYGFSLIDTWDVKPGDLVQKVDYSGRVPVPHHAMIYNGVDSKGEPTFNYSNGSIPYTIPNEITGKADTVGGYGVGKYYPDAVAKDKEHLWDVNVYRYTGTPQDSAQWTNEWLQKYGAGIEFAKGGKIYIKPSKRGTFTAAATKHGKSVQEFARQVLANKENYSPAMVKKANFARNAAGWKHSTGGPLYPFSFQKNPYWKTPVVRYDEGGHLFKSGGFSIPLILDKLQREEGELDRQINDLHIIKTTGSNILDAQNKKFHDWSVNIAEANKRGIPYDIRPVTDFTNLYNLAQKQDKYIDDANEVDYKYAIPYESDKIVKLSNGRKIPSNALDTLFKYSEEASIDPAVLLGLAMKETTFGYTGPYRMAQGKENMQKLFNAEHDYFRSQGTITPSELLNYHNLWANPYLGEWNALVDKAGGEPKRYGVSNYITPDEHLYNFMFDYLGTAQFPIEASGVFNWQNDKLIKQRMPILDRKAQEKLSINPWKAAAMQFLSGKYNPGDATHTQSVLKLGKELMNDPVVKKVQEAKKWKK